MSTVLRRVVLVEPFFSEHFRRFDRQLVLVTAHPTPRLARALF